nr:mitochondrial glutamate carrier 2 [Kogia breviceps]
MPAVDSGWGPGLGLYLGVSWAHRGQGPRGPAREQAEHVGSRLRFRADRPPPALELQPWELPDDVRPRFEGLRSGLSRPSPAPSCPPYPYPILAVRPASPTPPTPDPGPSVTATLIGRGVPGLLGVTRAFPIDLAEARLQNQRGQEIYKGTYVGGRGCVGVRGPAGLGRAGRLPAHPDLAGLRLHGSGLPGKTVGGEGFLGANRGGLLGARGGTDLGGLTLLLRGEWEHICTRSPGTHAAASPAPQDLAIRLNLGNWSLVAGAGGRNKTQVTCGKCTKELSGTCSPSGVAEKKGRFCEIEEPPDSQGPHLSRKLTGWGRGSLWLQTPHPRGFLPGAAVNLTAVTPEKAIKLTASDFRQQLLEDSCIALFSGRWRERVATTPRLTCVRPDDLTSIYCKMLCAAGLGQAVVTCPLEMLKMQLQCWAPAPAPRGPLSRGRRPAAALIARELLRTQGLVGLYRGLGAALLGPTRASSALGPGKACLQRPADRSPVGERGEPNAVAVRVWLLGCRQAGGEAKSFPLRRLHPHCHCHRGAMVTGLLPAPLQGLSGWELGAAAPPPRGHPLLRHLLPPGVREPTGKASFAHSFTSGCVAGPVTPLEAEHVAGGAARLALQGRRV